MKAHGHAYVGIATAVAVTVLLGFWPSYFGPLVRGGVDRPWVVHLHAAVFSGWVLLFVTQAWLASSGRRHVHRRLGRAGIVYGLVVLGLGVAVSLLAPALRVRAGQLPVEFASRVVLYNLTDMVTFALFLGAAVLLRRRPELHMRLILSATVALSGAAVGRVIQGRLFYVAVWLAPLFAAMGVDLVARRRVHPVLLASLAVFGMAYFKVDIISNSPGLVAVGRMLITPFL